LRRWRFSNPDGRVAAAWCTRIGTLRDTYGEDFAAGYRSDAKLENVLEREHVASLNQLIKKGR
jgi:hypothetical protein